MGAPVFNTKFIGNGSRREAKNPMHTPQHGGLYDMYAKGQKLYGAASSLYAAYQTGYRAYNMYQRLRPMIQAGMVLSFHSINKMPIYKGKKKKVLTPLELARRLAGTLHAVREGTPRKARYGIHASYKKT